MMKNAKVLIPIITILAAVAGAGLMYLALAMNDEDDTTTTPTTRSVGTTTRDVSNINSFEECAAAGFPIQETYPERCVADGKIFTRDVTPTVTTPTTSTVDEIEELSPTLRLKPPLSFSKVSSPLTVTGEAAGWYFEAEFPVRLEDANGNVLAQAPARAQGDWMTVDFVPFTVTLTFVARPPTDTGKLILEKSNPRGEGPVESVEVPVRFIN
jgi:hypothetical protein